MSRFGFRARLTALIALAFIVGGAAVLGVQWLLLRHEFQAQTNIATAMGFTVVGGDNSPPGNTFIELNSGMINLPEDTHTWISAEGFTSEELAEWLGESGWRDGEVSEMAVRELVSRFEVVHDTMNRDALNNLLLWSGATLAGFAALAALAAAWLSRRSLGRIAEITAATKAIGASDLHQRLALTGPRDEIKDLGDTIDGMLSRIQDAFDRQDRFIASASHELRTPLATTRAALEIPLEQGLIGAEAEEDVRIALAANDRGARMVSALLTLTRSKRAVEKGDDVAGTVDPGALLEDLTEERRSAAESAGVTIGLGDAATSRSIRGVDADPDLLALAIGNLLDNAIAYNRPGGEVAVSAGQDDDGPAWIEVSNDGTDLAEADVDKLREPFHRGEQTRLAGEGLGLGLALVDAVADSLGGTLTLAAREGGGLTARLSGLPAKG